MFGRPRPAHTFLSVALQLDLYAGHTCTIDHDGFYIVSYTMASVGLALGVYFIRLFPRLDRLPLDKWRAKHSSAKVA